ncbi:MAG: 50S ribosomal protein L22 [Planctomycetota bacterium]|nr:50S ribosomal protein L22 [Planctomycetota bacterium]
MKIRSDKLKRLSEQTGIGTDELASSVERTGLPADKAGRAVRNWIAGRDHPRCKAKDIANLSQTLGCEPRELACFSSEVRFHRGSNLKAKLIVDMIRGKTAEEALNILSFAPQRAAVHVRKALAAAVADAELADADPGELVISEATVNRATPIKRFRPKDRGRAHAILKRQSHITVSVQERD